MTQFRQKCVTNTFLKPAAIFRNLTIFVKTFFYEKKIICQFFPANA
jgi:hypothetical protein